ncbi:CAP domain-containing protein [Streptomyces sp. NPDC005012]|uniref:CAP domain-containing protein n=1 Tax=Streptomyces sp. NPDC005012 TaxID=3154558 RepID=UPI0033A504B2
MGRHRRSAAGRKGKGGTPRANGATPGVTGTGAGREAAHDAGHDAGHEQYRTAYDAYGSYGSHPYGSNSPYGYDSGDTYGDHAYARSDAYLFGTEEQHQGPAAHQDAPTAALPVHHEASADRAPRAAAGAPRAPRARRPRRPVRNGLLGVSAALAVGVVAAATGLVPGLDTYRLGGDGSIRAVDGPGNAETQQGGSGGRVDPGASSGAPGTESAKPSRSASPWAPEKDRKKAEPSPTRTPEKTATPDEPAPSTKAPAPEKPASGGGGDLSQEDAARAQVLQLVNQERAAAGCSPVKADSGLTELADDFSSAMAEQDFFDHTDPSGATPWDRAAAAGVSNLGGENIARGQADAAAVMDAWMKSDGHRANILNCDFKTLGVGVHFASGGPWWTQDFGY